MTLQRGAYLLHPRHGIGEVVSIGERRFPGHPAARYVELNFERDALTITLLEEDLADTVRELISLEQAHALIEQLRKGGGKPKTGWKARANAHEAALESADPFEFVKVVNELSSLEAADALSLRDRRHLSTARDLLIEELGCALNKTPEQIRRLISGTRKAAADDAPRSKTAPK
ncbi:MAG: CarD family transcriptional regulator [Xanthomonadales bacterium]